MLNRPPAPPADRHREQQRRYQQTYRRRQREGVLLVEVTPTVVEFLLVARWLKADESEDPAAIKDALDAFARRSGP